MHRLVQAKQESLQMQRDHVTCHKYEILHLKRLAIGELPSRTLKVITVSADGLYITGIEGTIDDYYWE